jgi:hypothetical protein
MLKVIIDDPLQLVFPGHMYVHTILKYDCALFLGNKNVTWPSLLPSCVPSGD